MNPLKLAKKKLIMEGAAVKSPTSGRCPKCGAPLYLVKSPAGSYLVCSNPLCDFYRETPAKA